MPKQGGKFALRFTPYKERPVKVKVFAKSPAAALEKAWRKSGLSTGRATGNPVRVPTAAQTKAKLKKRGRR